MSIWAMPLRTCKSRLAESRVMLFGFHICPLPTCWQLIYVSAIPLSSCPIWHRDVTIHSVTIRFILWHTACNALHDTILVIHISDILFIQEISIGEPEETEYTVTLVTVCTVIRFSEEERFQTLIVLKGVTWFFDSYCTAVSMYLYRTESQFPRDFQFGFVPLEQVLFVSIQAPAIWHAYR